MNLYMTKGYYIALGGAFFISGFGIIGDRDSAWHLDSLLKTSLTVASLSLFILSPDSNFKMFIIGCNLLLYSILFLVKFKDKIYYKKLKKSRLK